MKSFKKRHLQSNTGKNPSNHVSSKIFLSIWAHIIFWNFSCPKPKYQGCHIVKIEIEIKNIKLCLVFTHFHDIFIKILFFFQKQLSGWPYLIRPSVEFHDMYLILKDFLFLLKCNQWFAWKQSLHLPAYCVNGHEWNDIFVYTRIQLIQYGDFNVISFRVTPILSITLYCWLRFGSFTIMVHTIANTVGGKV